MSLCEPATSTTPPTCCASTAASVTGRSGGASMMTVSNTSSNRASRCFILADPRSSLGLGGICPDESTYMLSSPHGWRSSLTSAAPTRAVVSPAFRSRPRYSLIIGLRRSASTRHTVCPDWARAMARFVAVVLLPSPGRDEVTRTLFALLATFANLKLVLSCL
ncbi:hypothetical protein D9M72_484830 [compost metagenome]